MRSKMLPFKRSIMGCAQSGPRNAYFYSVSGGNPGTTYSRGRAKYRASSSGHHAENEALQGKLSLFTYGIFFCVGYGVLPVSFLRCAQMPRTAGKMCFLHWRCQILNMKVKIGVSEKGPKYISGAAPIIIFVFFGVAPRFREKRCCQHRQIFAETTENVVPNWRGPKTQFWHPRVRNGLSWSGYRNGPDISVALFAALADTSSRRQGQLFDIFCFFPSWQQVTFYHFNDWTFLVQ